MLLLNTEVLNLVLAEDFSLDLKNQTKQNKSQRVKMLKFDFARPGFLMLALFCFPKTHILLPLRSEQHNHEKPVTVPSDGPSSKYF